MNNNKKLLALLLTLMLVLFCGIPCVSAAQYAPVEVQAYRVDTSSTAWLTLLDVGGTAYITSKDASALTDMDITADGSTVTLTSRHHSVCCELSGVDYNGNAYYPFENVMEAASAKYYYSEGTETLFVMPQLSFAENLYHDCLEVFSDSGCDLQMIKSDLGTGLSVIYNVVGGMRFDYIWGNYTQEQYEKAFAGMMKGPDSKNDTLELMSSNDKLMKKLAKLKAFNSTDLDGTKHACEFLGVDYDGFIDAYSQLNKTVKGVSIGDALEIAQKIYAAQHSAELYVNAVKYSFIDNDHLTDSNIALAADSVYSYYDANRSTLSSVIEDAALTVTNNLSADAVKKAVTDAVGVNGTYVSAFKLLFDEYGMSNKTKAVEQTSACANLQVLAYKQFKRSLERGENGLFTGQSALTMKYTAIMYLRACQYAYSLYEFDDSLSWATSLMKDKTQNAILKLCAYDDTALTQTVENEPLDLSLPGFYRDSEEEKEEEPAATPRPTKQSGGSSGSYGDGYTLTDGDYQVSLSRNGVQTTSYGWRFYADTYEPDAYSDEEVAALKVGGTFEGVTITSLKKRTREVLINGYEFILRRKNTSSPWISYWPSDAPRTHLVANKEFRVMRSAQMYDNFTGIAYGVGSSSQKLTDFTDFFTGEHFKHVDKNAPIKFNLTVSGGTVTTVTWEYAP